MRQKSHQTSFWTRPGRPPKTPCSTRSSWRSARKPCRSFRPGWIYRPSPMPACKPPCAPPPAGTVSDVHCPRPVDCAACVTQGFACGNDSLDQWHPWHDRARALRRCQGLLRGRRFRSLASGCPPADDHLGRSGRCLREPIRAAKNWHQIDYFRTSGLRKKLSIQE
jgi:hypothetical protein